VVVMIGLVMLGGTVVNNAIVLIDAVNKLRAEGQPRREASSSRACLRAPSVGGGREAPLRHAGRVRASDAPLKTSAEELFQGPVALALTHIGQIALLRRLACAPVRGESYAHADIAAGRVRPEQSTPRREADQPKRAALTPRPPLTRSSR